MWKPLLKTKISLFQFQRYFTFKNFSFFQKAAKVLNIFSLFSCSSQVLVKTVYGYNVLDPAAYCAVLQIHHTDNKHIRARLTLLSASVRVQHEMSARDDSYNLRNQHLPAKNTNSIN